MPSLILLKLGISKKGVNMCENIGFYISQTSQGQQIGKKGLKGLFLVVCWSEPLFKTINFMPDPLVQKKNPRRHGTRSVNRGQKESWNNQKWVKQSKQRIWHITCFKGQKNGTLIRKKFVVKSWPLIIRLIFSRP